jgi:hypothetical protein
MKVDWYPPPISAALDNLQQWRLLKKGKSKSVDTALWIGGKDVTLSAEILEVQKVLMLPKRRYVHYHIWQLVQVIHMTKEEADNALKKFKNERPRAMDEGPPRKP